MKINGITLSEPLTLIMKVNLYQNGEQVGTDATYDAGFKGLVVGVNRSNDTTSRHWKGYVDELKVFMGNIHTARSC